mmetsp:Transcript_7884/g.22323  ORF Transcript_7884/g.22323 Transcript_7884/m.22323 type:complete len:233 (-) Transcript_7884:1607-2305(-)
MKRGAGRAARIEPPQQERPRSRWRPGRWEQGPTRQGRSRDAVSPRRGQSSGAAGAALQSPEMAFGTHASSGGARGSEASGRCLASEPDRPCHLASGPLSPFGAARAAARAGPGSPIARRRRQGSWIRSRSPARRRSPWSGRPGEQSGLSAGAACPQAARADASLQHQRRTEPWPQQQRAPRALHPLQTQRPRAPRQLPACCCAQHGQLTTRQHDLPYQRARSPSGGQRQTGP